MEINLLLGIISAIATLTCAVFAAMLHRKTERIKIMEGQLSEKRYSAYAKLYDFIYEIIKKQKDDKHTDDKEMRDKLLDAKKELIMYGTDDVVYALNKYLSSLSDTDLPNQLDYFLDIMLLIRKDMCRKSKLTKDDLLLNIMQDKKEVQILKEMKRNK